MKHSLKVGVSGVRGIVGESLTPGITMAFAQAFGRFVGQGSVLVGRDTRPTGPMLEYAVISGLKSVGCEPVLTGVVPTPTLLHLAVSERARGAICITASHNNVPWNALKFIDRNGMFLDETAAQQLFDVYHQQSFPLVKEPRLRMASRIIDPFAGHQQAILDYVDVHAIRKRQFKVAVDACNGVGAVFSKAFLEEQFGCEVVMVHDTPNGIFEREPEPLPENLVALCKAVVEHKCDIGFAQDPDGDRLAIVNERGVAIGEDLTLALGIDQVLSHHGKGPVAVNLSSSRVIDDVVRAHGCSMEKTKIGEINVSSRMLDIGAVAGGEPNGGLIIPAIHPCRDSFGSMAVILELLAMNDQTISEYRARYPSYHIIKTKMPIRGDKAPEILRFLRRKYEDKKPLLIDGVYVELGDCWIHVRPSNTEAVMRILCEAPTESEAAERVEEVRKIVEDLSG
jgi:phosphomannomutase